MSSLPVVTTPGPVEGRARGSVPLPSSAGCRAYSPMTFLLLKECSAVLQVSLSTVIMNETNPGINGVQIA